MSAACSKVTAILAALCLWLGGGCHGPGGRQMEIVKTKHRTDRQRAEAFHAEGVKLIKKGKPEKASEAFQKAIDADETFGPAYNNLGLLHFQRRQLYAAANAFQRAADLMPDRAEPFNNLGLTLESAAKPHEALALYQTAVDRDPENAEYLGNLLRIRIRCGEPVASLREGFQRLLLLDTRPDWIHWAEEHLALFDRTAGAGQPPTATVPESPEVIPTPMPGTDLPLKKGSSPLPPMAPLPMPWDALESPPLPK